MIRYREYGWAPGHWERVKTRKGKVLLPTPQLSLADLRAPCPSEYFGTLNRLHFRDPLTKFAGDIKGKYGTIDTFTVTNLQSLASSSTFQAGWTSAYIDNTTNLNLNSAAYGVIVSGTTPTAGSVRIYMYGHDGTNTLTFSSAGTQGTEGALTITDSEQLDASLVLIWSSDIDTTTNDSYVMPARSVRQAFGFYPRKWALYAAHNTVAALKSSGNAMYADHELRQYT